MDNNTKKPGSFDVSCVGRYYGVLNVGRLRSKLLVWEATGDARNEFQSNIKPHITEFLTDNSATLHDSPSDLIFSLFMVGRSEEKAKPTVFIVSQDKSARKEHFNMIKQSQIMRQYPGFELLHMPLKFEFEDLQRMADGGDFLTPHPPATLGSSSSSRHHQIHLCHP